MDETENVRDEIVTLTADIISAYVSGNHLQSAELPKLISDVYSALNEMAQGGKATFEPVHLKATPGEIRRSITHDYLISFEDGKSYKTLRRHLTLRGLTPEAYRQKWGLPHDYPMTSASYSEQRSELARSLGLGQQRRRSVRSEEWDEAVEMAEAAALPVRAHRRGSATALVGPLEPSAIPTRRLRAAHHASAAALARPASPSESVSVEARMAAKARRAVLEGASWLTAAEVAELAGLRDGDQSVQLSKWERDGAIFAIRHHGAEYYPRYALDPDHGYRPYERLARVLAAFDGRKDAWRLAYWFGSVNSMLGGARPCDVLAREPDRVIAAAEDEAEGPVHG